MPSSTSSSDVAVDGVAGGGVGAAVGAAGTRVPGARRDALRFVVAFVVAFGALFGIWETMLRMRAGASLELDKPPLEPAAPGEERWVVFGNCLVMTGVSGTQLAQELVAVDGRARNIVNIAQHEQTPIAFFEYLRRNQHYPDVVVTNVSSWVNGTNFEQEAALVAAADPLGLRASRSPSPSSPSPSPSPSPASPPAAAEEPASANAKPQHEPPNAQARAEEWLSDVVNERLQAVGHRYRLFDMALFAGTLMTTADLDRALFQLNMQPWYAVTRNVSDGSGQLGVEVRYRDDWNEGVEHMADRSVTRLGFQRLLTPRYWELLEAAVRDFESHGSRVILLRMPEHPKIRAFNDGAYETPRRIAELAQRTGAEVVDLSMLGVGDGVKLFDAVHPDAAAARVITSALARATRPAPSAPPPPP